jgi:hypothetical protein
MNLMSTSGREKFVTVQMKITEWFFKFVQLPLFLSLGASYFHGGKFRIMSSAVALLVGLINYSFIVPRVCPL